MIGRAVPTLATPLPLLGGIGLILALLLASPVSMGSAPEPGDDEPSPSIHREILSARPRPGDVLLRRGTTFTSRLVLTADPAAGYSHVGVVVRSGEAAEAFYGHLDAGEIEAAIDLLSVQLVGQFGREKIRAGLQETALDIQKKGGIDSVEIERPEGEATSEVALVTATVRFGNGTSSVETLKLALEDGAWRIQPEK